MKRKLMIMGVVILLIITNSIAVFANTETTVTLQANKTEVKAGETFSVTLKGTCPDGINGIATTYSYNTEELELQNATVANTNYSDSSNKAENEIFIYTTSTEKITEADLYVLTFKVKEEVEVGSEVKVSIEETLLDSDAATDSEHTIEAQEITIDIIGDEGGENPPADDGNDDDDDSPADDGNDNEENPPADDGNDNEENPPVDNGNDDTNNEEQPTTEGTTVVVGDDKKDNTTANKDIPKAGMNSVIIIAIIAVAGVSIVIYNKNKNYKDIK